MSNYTCYVGKQIRKYRKAGKMTLQDLADAIHKSRATICKYENGEIAVDIVRHRSRNIIVAPERKDFSDFFRAY